jgi:hypothetical protein
MRFSIEARDGYLQAVVHERNTGEEMHEFLLALHAACKQHGQPKILVLLRRSRAMFKPEDYGLDGEMRGYVRALVTPACRIAVLGDTHEVNAANEYIEMAARAQGLNVRAFREEHAALQWLQDAGAPSRRYRFTRIVISGAPDNAGVYALWKGDEVVYYGRSDGNGSTIRSRLLDHYYEAASRPTHYSWEVCNDPTAREAELLQEHRSRFGRLPRNNKAA